MSSRLVVLGKKKLLWTLVMVFGIIAPLMVWSYNIPVTKVSDPEAAMMTYSSDKEGIKFNYPQGWLIRTEKYFSGDVAENVSFSNSDNTAHGFVQVMILRKPIPEYITEAQKNMVPGYDSLQFSTKNIAGKNGYMLAYARGSGDVRTIAAEYFFRQNEKVYRFSCFYPEAQAEKYQKIFKEMLLSYSFPTGSGADNNLDEPKAEEQKKSDNAGDKQKTTGQ